MRVPVRSERDAFLLAIGLALVVGVAVLVGFLAAPLWGGVLVAVVLLGILAFVLLAKEGERARSLREAAEAPHPAAPPAKYRVLIVANEVLSGPELRDEIMRRVELWPELHVIAPILSSRLHRWTDDIDREREEAQARLEATLAWAAEQGMEAHGEVADADPYAAIEHALRRAGADEIIIATHPSERSARLETEVLERAREQLEMPVTHVVVEPEGVRIESTRQESKRRLPEKPVVHPEHPE